jgi:ferredoxin
MINQIRDKARELLAKGEVQCVIGWEPATDGKSTRPSFIYDAKDADRLVFDPTCWHNLTRFLRDRKGKKTGIVVKPCDSRAINLLINESQLARGDVYIIGVVCPGAGASPDKLSARCTSCRQHVPAVYDLLVGEPPKDEKPAAWPDVDEMEKKEGAARRAFWEEQFSHCIRCYACRQACPGCYCQECFADQLDPQWIGPRIAPAENEVWNTIRAFHLAGRCVSCGACEQACPVNIPLMLLNRKLEKDAVADFGFEAGLSAEAKAPFATFKKEEKLEGAY